MGARLSQADNKDAQVELHLIDSHLKVETGYDTRPQGHRAPNVRLCTVVSSGKWDSPGVGPCGGAGVSLKLR